MMRRRSVAPGGGGTSQARPAPAAELKPFRNTPRGSAMLTMPVSVPGTGFTSIGSNVTRLVVHLAPLWQATQFAPPGASEPKTLRPFSTLPLVLGDAIGLRIPNAIQFVMSSCCCARLELAGP